MRARGHSSSARWRSAKRCSARNIPIRRTASTSLAILLQTQGDLAGARPLYERALAIREKVLGPSIPIRHRASTILPPCFSDQGDLARRATAPRARAGDPREGARPRASRLRRRASTTSPSLLSGSGRPCAGTVALRARTGRSCERALGPEHPNTNRARCHLSRLLLLIGHPTEALTLSETALNAHDKVLGRTTPGPRTAPASQPTRSTRLAAQRRRRRCGSGMGSRVLKTLSPHEPLSGWPRTLLAKVKQQRRALPAFLKSGWAALSSSSTTSCGPSDSRAGGSPAETS